MQKQTMRLSSNQSSVNCWQKSSWQFHCSHCREDLCGGANGNWQIDTVKPKKKNTKIKKPTTNVFNYISKIIRKMYVMKGGPSLWDSQSWGTQEWSQALLSAAVSSIDFNLCVLCQREISLWHQSLGFLSFLSKQTACSPVLDSGGCANQHRERPD